jgi:nitrite reductase/ring-hydroxylating ferredoxin subunit
VGGFGAVTLKTENWVTVASEADLSPGDVTGTTVNGVEIAIYNVDGKLYATDDVCPHAYAHLSDGWLEGNVIECPLHAGQFDVTCGKGLGPPIDSDIRTFNVRISEGAIQVNVGS